MQTHLQFHHLTCKNNHQLLNATEMTIGIAMKHGGGISYNWESSMNCNFSCSFLKNCREWKGEGLTLPILIEEYMGLAMAIYNLYIPMTLLRAWEEGKRTRRKEGRNEGLFMFSLIKTKYIDVKEDRWGIGFFTWLMGIFHFDKALFIPLCWHMRSAKIITMMGLGERKGKSNYNNNNLC